MPLTLRNYQLDLIARARAEMAHGAKRVLLVLPCGAGKTVLMAQMLARAAAKGKRAWFVVHRSELLEQSVSTFREAAGIHTGIIAAGYPTHPLAPVQVCSVQTLTRRLAHLTPPDFLVFDECHHVASATWSAISAHCPAAHSIGLTATPARLDGRGLGPYFDALICGPSVADLIQQGWLSRYRLYAPGGGVDLQDVPRQAGDYQKRKLDVAMTRSTVTGDAVAHYQTHCPGARALTFTWSLEASRRLVGAFLEAGVSAAHVDGETSRGERLGASQRFREGSLEVLSNVDICGEGLDVPALDAVFLLRPTQSLGLYLQQVGRGLRPAPGKDSVQIFDHVQNFQRHGLPDDPRDWKLTMDRAKAPREPLETLARCPQCFYVFRAGLAHCPACGVAMVVKARKVEERAGQLQEANLDELRALRGRIREFYPACQTLADWQALAKRLNYRSGWAFYKWKASMQHRRTA